MLRTSARRIPALAASVLVLVTLPGCLSSSPKEIDFRWRGTETLNPNSQGDPTPVNVKLMLLKDCTKFEEAGLDALWSDPAAALGDSLVGEPLEVVVTVGDEGMVQVPVRSGTEHLGIVGLFNALPEGDERQRQCLAVGDVEDFVVRFTESAALLDED